MPDEIETTNNGTPDLSYNGKDYLWLHIRALPFFRALLRAVEARFYREISLPSPTLDLGCGDGHFASVAFERKVEIGVDPWKEPIRSAANRGSHRILIQSDAGRMPFPDDYFGSAFSNSVLEHIPDVDQILEETKRVLAPGAPFTFSVPNHQFNPSLSIGRSLDKLGLQNLGDRYRKMFDRIARHIHLDPPEIWETRLNSTGFELIDWWHFYSPGALRITEWGHFFGLPSLFSYKLTGKWILSPTSWNLAIPYKMTKKYYDEPPIRDDGVCTFFSARCK